MQRIALRALCFPPLQVISPQACFKLIKSNVLIALAMSDHAYSSLALNVSQEAINNISLGVASKSSGVFAYKYAADAAYMASLAGYASHLHQRHHAILSKASEIAGFENNPALSSAVANDIRLCGTLKNLHNGMWSIDVGMWSIEDKHYGTNLENRFLQYLDSVGLDFLIEDTKNIFKNCIDFNHIDSYKLNFSSAIEQDPELLKRAIILGEDTEPSQAVRILLLGSGGAGKTQLAKRLKGEEYCVSVEHATCGIAIDSDEAVDLVSLATTESNNNEIELTNYLWDFGGQRLFYGLHSTFMHENCVYVVVADSRHEQAVDYWLHQIEHIAGSYASVLVVTNLYEGCVTQQNETRLRRLFPGLIKENSFHYFSCLEPIDRSFVERLIELSMDSRKRIFSTTAKVIEQLKEEFKCNRFLYRHQIENTVSEIIGGGKQIDVSIHDQLKQLGKVIYLDGGSDKICLDPNWLIECAYKLINSELLRGNNGRVSLSEIRKNKDVVFPRGSVNDDDIEQLVNYIAQVGQCTLIDDQYFFPDACPTNEPSSPRFFNETEDSLNILFDLTYFPIGLHASFVNALHKMDSLSVDPNYIWRDGFVLFSLNAERQSIEIATIEYETRNGTVRIHTLYSDTRIVASALERINSHLKDIMKNTSASSPVTPYISYRGKYCRLNWHDFIELLNREGQSACVVNNNYYGEFMGDKYVTNIPSNNGIVNLQVSGTKNKQKSTTIPIEPADDEIKKIMQVIVKYYISNASGLTHNELKVVTEVDTAIREDDQRKLQVFWCKLREVAGFVADATTIARFANDSRGPILAALASASSYF